MTDNSHGGTMPGQAGETCTASELCARIRAEYREMPGLCLTPAQAARLWDLTPGVCAQVLQMLAAEGTLVCTRDVRYVAAVHGCCGWRGGRGARPEQT